MFLTQQKTEAESGTEHTITSSCNQKVYIQIYIYIYRSQSTLQVFFSLDPRHLGLTVFYAVSSLVVKFFTFKKCDESIQIIQSNLFLPLTFTETTFAKGQLHLQAIEEK